MSEMLNRALKGRSLSLSSSASSCSSSSPSSPPTSSLDECEQMAAVASKWANRKCAVCSAPAKSFNYNALTCQSCRLFFFRHAWQRNSLVCFGDQHCPMLGVARKCQKCRMDRCIAQGMEPRRVKFNRNKLSAPPHYHQLNQYSNPTFPSPQFEEDQLPFDCMETFYLNALARANAHLPNEMMLPSSRTETDFEAVLNLPALYLKYVTAYCREMYAFNELSAAQQAKLFKAFFPQFIITRLASVLDSKQLNFRSLADETGIHVTIINPDHISNLWFASLLLESMSGLLPLAALLEGDTVIRDLFTALLYFQAAQQVQHFEVMRYHYHIYSNLLLSYLISKYTKDNISLVNPHDRHRQLLAFNEVMEAAAVTAKVRLALIFNVSEKIFNHRFRLDEALEKIYDIPLYQSHFPLNSPFFTAGQ